MTHWKPDVFAWTPDEQVLDHNDKGWIVMEAPTGHRFCLANPQRGNFAARANQWGGA